MKKRTKSAGQFKRFYASGIPMYRERNKPIDLPAKAMVNIIKLKTKTAICGFKDMVLSIPLDNFLGDSLVKKTKKGKAKAAKIVTPEITVETAPVVAIEQPVIEQAPVVAEVAPEAPQAIEIPVTEVAPVVAETIPV
jgi:hypothetical protein